MSHVNNGITDISFEEMTKSFDESKNGCIIHGFTGGKLELLYRVTNLTLTVQYVTQFTDVNPGNPVNCIMNGKYDELYF